MNMQGERLTFIKALESSPVHCLNPQPCRNRHNPANGGTTAMLAHTHNTISTITIYLYFSHTADQYRPVFHLHMFGHGLGQDIDPPT